MRRRQLGAGEGALHFRKALLFPLCQVGAVLHHAANLLFHSGPAQPDFLGEAAPGQAQALTVVIHKAVGAIQPGMAVTADTVFVLQEFLRFLRAGMLRIQGRDPEFAALVPAAAPQDMLKVFL